ncbi:MAG: hypothetical protein KDH19_12115, partial [Geminicoccaceae bacterium]|nr:hypothetical protein [Geminicoccaceae bacterium]
QLIAACKYGVEFVVEGGAAHLYRFIRWLARSPCDPSVPFSPAGGKIPARLLTDRPISTTQ